MLSSEGETMLSTSQGAVTVMAPHNILSSSSVLKIEGDDEEHHHSYSHPITVLHPLTCTSVDQDSELHDEVVYSITNVEVSGGSHHHHQVSF